MDNNYVTSIHNIKSKNILLLIECCLQSNIAYNIKSPSVCQKFKIVAPEGYEFIDWFQGVDYLKKRASIEYFGLVFRSIEAPYDYIFSFRDCHNFDELIKEFDTELITFEPLNNRVTMPSEVKVGKAYLDMYTSETFLVKSMQQQLFKLLDTYSKSAQPINRLYITGHGLGGALSLLFSLDVALCLPHLIHSNINFGTPRVGNSRFVKFFDEQQFQENELTRTINVHNTYDIIPCLPSDQDGYCSMSHIYLIAFFMDRYLMPNFEYRHSCTNYQRVLNNAQNSKYGIFEGYFIHNRMKMKSIEPDTNTVCMLA